MNRPNRKLALIIVAALVANVVLIAGLRLFLSPNYLDFAVGDADVVVIDSNSEEARTRFPELAAAAGGRRPNQCPTAAMLQQRAVGNRFVFVMELGPVSFSFAPESIDIDSRLRADHGGRFGGLVAKVPLTISGGDPRTGFLRGERAGGGMPPRFDYSEGDPALGDAGEYLEREPFTTGRINNAPGFVPGTMHFPEPGCYQVFVTVDGIEHGPFGIEVSAQS